MIFTNAPTKGTSQKLTPEQINEREDALSQFEENLPDFDRATLFWLMKLRGMDTQKAREIRVKAGAIK